MFKFGLFKKNILFIVIFCMVFLLNSCSHFVVLNPKGEIGIKEKSLIILSSSLMLVVVLPALVMILVVAWRYRRSNEKAKYAPEWNSSRKIEVVIWTIPSIIILILAIAVWIDAHKLDPYKPLKSSIVPITIQVISFDWKWLFIYPEQHIATINKLVFPVNRPIHFILTSATVMNSFFIPQLGSQIMTMPGMETQLNLIANFPGIYAGISANFSGRYFTNMKFEADAVSEVNFLSWVANINQSAPKFNLNNYNELITPNIEKDVKYFADMPQDVFFKIISQYKSSESVNLEEK